MVSTLELIHSAQLDLLSAQPVFQAQLLAAQPVASVSAGASFSTVTKISWPTPLYDTYNSWSSLNPTVVTPQLAGYYLITGQVYFAANTTGSRIINISMNGGTGSQTLGQATMAANSDNFYGPVLNCSAVGFFNGTTDFVQLACYQQTGSNLNASAFQTRISLLRIHT